MYPMINSWVTFKTNKEGNCCIKDHLLDDEYTVEPEVAHFLRRLDGKTNPYRISSSFSKSEVNQILEMADDMFLVRKSKTVIKTFGSLYRTLYTVKPNRNRRTYCRALNALLMLLWLPVLLIGIKTFLNGFDRNLSFDYITLGSIVSLIIGMFLHEIGHGVSTICYGGKVFEMGIKIGLLPGAYVFSDDTNIKSTMKRIQTLAAGVEMNFMFSGVLLILAVCLPQFAGFCFGGAITNFSIGLLNLLFIEGLDGQKIVCELLGDSDLFSKAKRALFISKERKRVLKEGGQGYVKLAACASLLSFQFLLPIIIIINILGVLT